ncbi:crotonase/enoyl-CoA hydratase family protein [Nocardioides pelophilus]|uniref:crotonase/enoyl-CoA hydratase family protein n=1 Tax=Nocardioides pelophilus TaxID=2172019 RepID=UPI001603E4B6|nr:crotonase/enoyl-CoA hydratase family protein [Nocardioides pelophilus]
MADAAPWRRAAHEGPDSPYDGLPLDDDERDYRTLTYEVDGRVARLTFDRPEQGNSITPDTPGELAAAVERADLDPRVHVIVLSGRGKGFCGGYDLTAFAEQAIPNHDPAKTWDPMVDYAMMSRFTRGYASLLHANKPTVAKIHGFCVAGGTDIALHCDQVVIAADAKIGYPPTRVWGVPSAGLWAHRLGDQRAKRLLLTGDCLSGREAAEWGLAIEAPEPDRLGDQRAKRLLLTGDCLSGREAAEWGLAIEAPEPDRLDERTEALVQRIAAMPINQLMMVKLALNSALLAQGVQNSQMISTVFDGISRHTREGYSFAARAADVGFKQAVRERDSAPYDDFGPSTNKG